MNYAWLSKRDKEFYLSPLLVIKLNEQFCNKPNRVSRLNEGNAGYMEKLDLKGVEPIGKLQLSWTI